MPISDDVIWLAVVELDGDKHVLKLSGSPNEARERKHLQQTNPALKILVLKRATLEEIQAMADVINADPNHVPMTDMNQFVPQESGPIGPDGVVRVAESPAAPQPE